MREDFDGLRLAWQEYVRTHLTGRACREKLPGARAGRRLLPRYPVT